MQLYSLKGAWEGIDRFWVTFQQEDTNFLLAGEKVHYAFSPTNRNLKNLFRNMILSFRILKKEQPSLVITTGAGVAVPFIYVAKVLRIKTVYIESMTRIKDLSLTGKMLVPVVDRLFVQWPELAVKYRKAEFRGQVI